MKLARFVKLFIPVLVAGALLFSVDLPAPFKAPLATVHAQQYTTTQTTLSSAVTDRNADRILVASATGFAVDNVVVVDKEAMRVRSITSTTIYVIRGQYGTAAATHASGAVVFTGLPTQFSGNDPSGNCTAANEVSLPRVLFNGNVYDCKSSVWVRYRLGGLQSFTTGAVQTYTGAGAITVQQGLSLIGGSGALAMTLAAPTALQEGMEMEIFASVAQAHTITFTGGFNGGTTARDVCTLGGAIGDGIKIRAYNLIWYVVANRNCTLG